MFLMSLCADAYFFSPVSLLVTSLAHNRYLLSSKTLTQPSPNTLHHPNAPWHKFLEQQPFPTPNVIRPGNAARRGRPNPHSPYVGHGGSDWARQAGGGARQGDRAPREKQDKEPKHWGWLPGPVTATPAQPPALRRLPPGSPALRRPPLSEPTAADFSAPETYSEAQRHGHQLTIQLKGCE